MTGVQTCALPISDELADELTDGRSHDLVPVMDMGLTGDESETPAHLVGAVQ